MLLEHRLDRRDIADEQHTGLTVGAGGAQLDFGAKPKQLAIQQLEAWVVEAQHEHGRLGKIIFNDRIIQLGHHVGRRIDAVDLDEELSNMMLFGCHGGEPSRYSSKKEIARRPPAPKLPVLGSL